MRLRLGCVPDLRIARLQSVVGLLYAADPALAIEVTHLRSAGQLDLVRAGELDFGLVHHAGDDPTIEAAPVFAGEQLVVLLPIGHRLAGEPALGVRDLDRELLLVSPRAVDPGLHDRLMGALERDGHRFAGIREIGGADVRDPLFAAAGGDGIALASRSTLTLIGELAALLVDRPLRPPLWMPDTLVAWSADPSAQLRAIVAAARGIARDLFRLGRQA